METLLDYDLNIYRLEEEGGVYTDPWFLDIYLVSTENTESVWGAVHKQLAHTQIALTPEESAKLQLGTGYFTDNDSWYGLDGFLKDYEHQISDRLWDVFNALPSTKED